MDKLGCTIVDHFPNSVCKQDLLCHQLNICSKVKVEVQNLSVELIVSRMDSAMSLIQAAKNLMNAMVQMVKASYVTSTEYQKSQGMASLNLPAVSWKMKAPEKKPLKKHVIPVQALSKFKAMESIYVCPTQLPPALGAPEDQSLFVTQMHLPNTILMLDSTGKWADCEPVQVVNFLRTQLCLS
uniref:Uncharacterized protein n=1 Tax=Aotus nancymaae TaxID=37293 RepID=A0A2K5E8L1_AOTNA